MEYVDANEAQQNFPALLEEVERGKSFAITKDGERIAQLVPFTERLKETIEALKAVSREWAKGHKPLTFKQIKEMVEEGREPNERDETSVVEDMLSYRDNHGPTLGNDSNIRDLIEKGRR